jgi:hypothetical protein
VLSSVAQKITDQHDAAWISATANHNVVKAGKILSDPHLPDTGFIRTTEIITELRALHVVLKLNSDLTSNKTSPFNNHIMETIVSLTRINFAFQHWIRIWKMQKSYSPRK